MTPSEAVASAKEYLKEIYASEEIINLGLEEIEFDEDEDVWNITLGFFRGWNRVPPNVGALFPDRQILRDAMTRDYRIVKVRNEDKKVVSVKLREIAA